MANGAPKSEYEDIPIPVKASLGGLLNLEISAKPAQVAIVLRMTAKELLDAKLISPQAIGLVATAVETEYPPPPKTETKDYPR